jgi:hypothetical protein
MNRLDVAADQPDLEQPPLRRVREEVRDGVVVAVTSIAASVALVLIAAIVMSLVG